MEATTLALGRVLLEQLGQPNAKTMPDEEVQRMLASLQTPATAAAAPQAAGPVWIDSMSLSGVDLDFWTAKALGMPVELRGGQAWIKVDGQDVAIEPSQNMQQAGLILRDCKIELRPPLNDGEPWEAWFDRLRAQGRKGNGVPPVIGTGPDWPRAVCRSAVIARFGDKFDATNPVPADDGKGHQTAIGQPRAIIGPAPEAAA